MKPEETAKATVKAGLKARAALTQAPEDRNQYHVIKEKELVEEKERETGWKKVAGGGLKGGSPAPSTVPSVSNSRHI